MRSSFRKYSTESTPTPQQKSNTALYAALGSVAVAGLGYFIYASSDTAKEAGTAAKSAGQAIKVAANFVPTKEDYQKVISLIHMMVSKKLKINQVYNEIANILEENGEYDGEGRDLKLILILIGWLSHRWLVWPRPRPTCMA